MVGRATTGCLRVVYASFALLWVALAVRSAHQGDHQEAIVFAVVAVAWVVVVVSIALRPSRFWRGDPGRRLSRRSRRGRGGAAPRGR